MALRLLTDLASATSDWPAAADIALPSPFGPDESVRRAAARLLAAADRARAEVREDERLVAAAREALRRIRVAGHKIVEEEGESRDEHGSAGGA